MAKPENLELWPGLESDEFWEDSQGLFPELEKSFLSPAEQQRLVFREFDRLTKTPNLTFGDPEKGEEDYWIFLPYSSTLLGWLYENEQIAEMLRVFKMQRLGRVKSLSLLSAVDQLLDEEGYETPVHFIEFPQDRLLHTLTVSRFMEVVLRRLNFPEDQIKIGVAAAVLHDIATPAFGDSTKLLDKASLHEEDWWHDMVDKEGWKYLQSIGATREQLDDIIHNKGVLGRLLDISDRISYTLIDSYHAFGLAKKERLNVAAFDEVLELLDEDKDIGNIWEEIEFDEESQDFYFTNPARLGRVLLLRALMHKILYIHPWSQSRDIRGARLLEPLYSKEREPGKLTPQDLRRLSDEQLLFKLLEFYKLDSPERFNFYEWYPEFYEIFDSREEADRRAQGVTSDPALTLFAVKSGPGFDPATDYKVQVGEDGLFTKTQIVPYREAEPERARYIEELARKLKRHYVYFFKKGNADKLTISVADETRDGLALR